MSHNAANTIAYISWLVFIAVLMVTLSPWWFTAIVVGFGSFPTDRELDERRKESQ